MKHIKITTPLCFSKIGQRQNPEDSIYPSEGEATSSCRVLMVCDGMGGHEKGEVASQTVANVMGSRLSSLDLCSMETMKEHFLSALQEAQQELDRLDDGTSEKKMGTTLTFWSLCSDGILMAHIGDSRIYQLRPDKGVIFHTKDHSLVQELITAGEMTEEEAQHSKIKNVITRAVQPHEENPSRPTFDILTDIRPGDVFLLCSDGVTEKTDDKQLAHILLQESDLEQRLKRLEEHCAKAETRDNHSCYIVQIEEVDGRRYSKEEKQQSVLDRILKLFK